MSKKKYYSGSGFMPARVVHLHPTRFCNLSCKHCYSSSGVEHKLHLGIDEILLSLEILLNEGYKVVSLSGGEPLFYRYLEELLVGAKDIGFQINIISNGTPVSNNLIPLLKSNVDLIAISLDGAPETHNYFRNHPRAFDFAKKALQSLFEAGVETGIAFCVSTVSLKDMVWAFEFAESMQCSVLQFHPFAATGRGINLKNFELDKVDRARAYTIAAFLESNDKPKVQIDLSPTNAILSRQNEYLVTTIDTADEVALSDLVNPIVINEKGELYPISYGLHSKYKIGKLGKELKQSISSWKRHQWFEIKELIEKSFSEINKQESDYIDWFYHLVKTGSALQSTKSTFKTTSK